MPEIKLKCLRCAWEDKTMMIMTTKSDLRNWANDQATGQNSDDLEDAFVARILELDHPRWVDDWETFLDGLDVGEMFCELAKGQ